MIRFYKFISYFLFPGSVACLAYAFLLFLPQSEPLQTAVQSSAEAVSLTGKPFTHYNLPFFQLNLWIPILAYIVIPIAVVFYLKFTHKISSIQLPQASDRKIPLFTSLFMSFGVIQFHIHSLSSPEYLLIGRGVPNQLHNTFANQYIRNWLSTHIAWELTTFSILILLSLLITFLITEFAKFKISIHLSSITSAAIFLTNSLLRIQQYAKNQPQNVDIQLPKFVFCPQLLPMASAVALWLIITMYFSRLKLKAHTPKELWAAIALSILINIPVNLVLYLLYPH